MTVIELAPGKQVTISSDDRAEGIWLALWANGGSLGVELDLDRAEEIGLLIYRKARQMRRAKR